MKGTRIFPGPATLRCRAKWLDRVGLRREEREQPGVDEEFLASGLLLAEQAGRDESLEVARCCLPPGNSGLEHERLDLPPLRVTRNLSQDLAQDLGWGSYQTIAKPSSVPVERILITPSVAALYPAIPLLSTR